MAYRGEDLDLRTPQGWGPAGRDAPPGNEPNWWTRSTVYKGGRADPIWIDDTVMACCNHAFDLAVAHRALEVRLEHFINAMTLNDQIAKVLEARGIGVASLRRESGSIIAAEIPAGPAGGKAQPKRSEALEEMLRLAADHAYPRRTPVTVDDVLHVLIDMKRDLPGIQLLQRHAAPWSARNGSEQRPELRLEPLPHLAPRPYTPEPRYASQAAHDYFTQPAAVPYQPPQYREPAPAQTRGMRERETASASIDTVQNTRIEALERAVRDLGVDLVEDRKSLQSVVGDLQRQSAVQSDDTQRFRGNLTDRLNSLEDTFHRTRSDSGTVPNAVFERMAGVERTVEGRIAGIERVLDNRIAELGHGWNVVSERLQSIEQGILRPIEQGITPALAARLEAVSGLERKLDGLERTFSLILDRLTGLERQLATPRPSVDLTPVQVRIGDLERSLIAKLPQTVDMAAVNNLSSQLAVGMSDLEQRIGTKLQQSVDLSPVADLLSGIESRIAGLERSLENRSAETGRTVATIVERLRAFEEAINTQKTQSVDRLGQIERSLTTYADHMIETGATHERDLGELHEALVKLNTNQQTLANSLEQWRLDNTGDLSVVNNRLRSLEETNVRRDPALDTLSTQIAAIHSAVAKREVTKSRFKQWLFGTQEWYSASYDTQRWRAREIADTANGSGIVRVAARPATPSAPPAPPASAPTTIRRQ